MTVYKDRLETCYWCGKPASGKEHIPPQNLFPKEFRSDLMTVGSCQEHNQNLSKLDERMRYHMTQMGDAEIARNHFEDKTMKGLIRKEGLGLTVDLFSNSFTDYSGKNWQRVEPKNSNLYFEKIIRGVFFYHFGLRVSGTTSFFSNKIRLMDLSANAHFFYHLLEDELSDEWIEGSPKNKDIFDYKYYYLDKEDRFCIIMTFYKEHKIIGMSLPKDKSIDDYGLEYEEYNERIKKLKKNKT